MDPYLRAAECALRRSAAPALHLSELLRQVRCETRDLSLDGPRLQAGLLGRPDTFRVLDPWRGPWRFLRDEEQAPRSPDLDPWVVVVSDPADGDGVGHPSTRRLQACVRWLARDVDPRSGRALARWSVLVMSAEETRCALEAAA
jgi:hypothetical protein